MDTHDVTYCLEIIQGVDRGLIFPIIGDRVIIGRSKHSDILLRDEGISRQHLELALSRENPGMVQVRDLKSRNGVFIRKEKILETTIPCGEYIQIGESLLVVRAHSPDDDACKDTDSGVNLENCDTGDAMIASIGVENIQRFPLDFEKANQIVIEKRLNSLYKLGEILTHPGSLNEKLNAILDMIFDVLPAEDGCILIKDKVTQELQPQIARQAGATEEMLNIRVSWTIIERCIRDRIGIVASDALADPRFDGSESVNIEQFRSVLSVPLFFNNTVWGVIFLNTSLKKGLFSEDDLTFLTGIANKAAIVIEHHQLMQAHIERLNMAEVGELVASLSHYIKNILFAFSSAQILLDDALKEKDFTMIESVWPILKDNAGHISDLVKDMLYFSKNRPSHKEFLLLNQIIIEVVTLYRPTAKGKNIVIETNLDPQLPPTAIDPKSFHRVVLNLLKNALDAVPREREGLVKLNTSYDEANQEITFSVVDNGVGIPTQNFERIFHYLFSTKGYEGTGIGLFVTRKIIEEHGGTILLESTVDVGTTFTIKLPLCESLDVSSPDLGIFND